MSRRILGEFSLDNEDGALTRVVTQLEATNGKFQGDIEKQIKAAVREFSLDDENSALSRLVKRSKKPRTDHGRVLADNQDSAITKLNLVLAETRQSIDDNLTLDNEQSALARLKKQLTDILDDIQTKNQRFQEDVSGKLASLVTKHQEEMRSTTHGISFEEEFCTFLQREAQRAGDVFTATGSRPGAIPRCKTGDAVIELGSEAAAAGERIVFEAKGNKQYSLVDARGRLKRRERTERRRWRLRLCEKYCSPRSPALHSDRPRSFRHLGRGRPINRHLPVSRRQCSQGAALPKEG